MPYPENLTEAQLKTYAEDAISAVLAGVTSYSHEQTQEWNEKIIQSILKSLISTTSTGTPNNQPPYKFAVNSTIVQHAPPTAPIKREGDKPVYENNGKRGMHSAAGAYWNNDKDGMWSFKYPGAEDKGLDVVVCVLWFAI